MFGRIKQMAQNNPSCLSIRKLYFLIYISLPYPLGNVTSFSIFCKKLYKVDVNSLNVQVTSETIWAQNFLWKSISNTNSFNTYKTIQIFYSLCQFCQDEFFTEIIKIIMKLFITSYYPFLEPFENGLHTSCSFDS